MKNKRISLISSAIIVIIITGLQFSVIKYSLSLIESTPVFLWLRFFVAFIAAFLYAKIKKIPLLRDKSVILLAFIHPFSAFYLQSLALNTADVTASSVITALSPAITPVMAFFAGEEKINSKEWFLISLILLGGVSAAFFRGKSGNFFTVGAFFMLMAIILRGVYYVYVHRISKRISPYEISYAQMSWSFLFYTILALLSGDISKELITSFTFPAILSILYMGILSTTVVFFLNNYLLSSLPVSVSASLAAATFVVNLLAASFINGEDIPLPLIISSSVMIISIILLAKSKVGKR